MILKPGCLKSLAKYFRFHALWDDYVTGNPKLDSLRRGLSVFHRFFSSADDTEIFVVFRMASKNVENQIANDPEYITYLLDQSQEFDWYFDVGNGLNNTSVVSLEKLRLAILSFGPWCNLPLVTSLTTS